MRATEKTCLHCHGIFVTASTRQKYCGQACNNRYNAQRRWDEAHGLSVLERLTHESPEVQQLIKMVCRSFGVTYNRLTSKSRRRMVVMPRHILVWMSIEKLRMRPTEVAKIIHRDLTTVGHSIEAVQDWMETKDSVFMSYYNKLKTA